MQAKMEIDLSSIVNQACKKFDNDRGRMIDILWEVQNKVGCVNGEAMELIAQKTSATRVDVEGIVSFYQFFSEDRIGHIIMRL